MSNELSPSPERSYLKDLPFVHVYRVTASITEYGKTCWLSLRPTDESSCICSFAHFYDLGVCDNTASLNQQQCTVTPKCHQMHVRSISTPPRQQSWYVSTLFSVCASTGSIYFVTVTLILSPLQHIHKASTSAICWSTVQHFSTEQIEPWDTKSDTDTTLKHPSYFQNKKTLCWHLIIFLLTS